MSVGGHESGVFPVSTDIRPVFGDPGTPLGGFNPSPPLLFISGRASVYGPSQGQEWPFLGTWRNAFQPSRQRTQPKEPHAATARGPMAFPAHIVPGLFRTSTPDETPRKSTSVVLGVVPRARLPRCSEGGAR